jgi:photosystem II stability/assembly factor-like uncharacterized protein
MKLLRRGALCALTIIAVAAVAASAADEKDKSKGPAPFESLEFRLAGPFTGGRVSRAVGIPGDPYTYYLASASGGVWKSVDGGLRWASVFDDQPIASIGSIAVSLSDPNVIYVGSGEANIRGNVAPGNGIYKSTDAGKTWTHAWKQEGQIGTIIVHPTNPDVAFAAVLGHAFGPNPERGVYRTQDGGKTWQQVLKKDADTGASDVCFDPTNPRILFAGLWQARRRPWEMTSGGPGSGLYVSRDGGDSWKPVTKGLPEGIWGKVGVAVAASDPRRVYALIEAEKGGLYRSDDGGESFRLASGHRSLRQRAWYYTTLTVDPTNADVVWFPQVPLLRTIDGGATIKLVEAHHGDHHDMWVDPKNPKRLITAQDGGVSISTDGGENWFTPPLPIAQFYHVSADTSVPYRVMGAMQDMGTASGPSNSLSRGGIANADWHTVGGGEAGHAVADPSDPNIVYAGEYLGVITHYDHRTGQARNVSVYPNNLSGHGIEDAKYRFQWTAPIVISPHDPKTVYHGGNVLFRTRDAGQSWTAISPDLTRNDRTKMKWSGGPISGDNTGVEHYGTIFAVAESPLEKGLIWAGSDDGLVHVTRDGGATWTNVTASMPKFPEWGTVSLIEASPFDAGTAYVVIDAHRLDDMRPYLFKTSDFGKTWKTLSVGLPQDVYLHAVREDPKRRGMLYVGTERGVAFSRDDGATWAQLGLNLPTVAVHDLVVKGDDLVLGTHGRSIWILDDLTPLRETTPAVQAKAAQLFPVPPTVAWRYRSDYERGLGKNPPAGALIHYFLKEKVEGELTIEILDAKGRLVRTLSSKEEQPEAPKDDPDGAPEPKKPLATKAGVQRAVWDLTWQGARKIKKAKVDWGDPEQGMPAIPGTYTARLKVAGQTLETPIEVRQDPRVKFGAAALEAQLEFALKLRDDIGRLTDIVHALRSVREQLQARRALVEKDAAWKAWTDGAKTLVDRLDALEGKLHNPKAEVTYDILMQKGGAQLYSKLIPLYSFAIDGDGAPTQGMLEMHAGHARELATCEAEWKELTAAVAALNAQAKELNAAVVVVPAPPR